MADNKDKVIPECPYNNTEKCPYNDTADCAESKEAEAVDATAEESVCDEAAETAKEYTTPEGISITPEDLEEPDEAEDGEKPMGSRLKKLFNRK